MASERGLQMAELFRSGKTLQEIGDQFGVTRQRVHGVLKRQGITWRDGGVFLSKGIPTVREKNPS